jgi:hypothetical protein
MIRRVSNAEDGVTTPAENDAEVRWAAAQSVLDRAPTSTARHRLRRFKVLTWSFIVGVALLIPAVAVLLVVLFSGAVVPDVEPSSGWVVAGLVVQGVGVLVVVGYLLVGWRAGLFRGAWSQPAAVLDRAQRRSLLAQVRGRVPVDARRLPLARAVAERLAIQRYQLLLFVGLTLQQVGRAVTSPGALNVVLTVASLVLYLLGAVLLCRDGARARRFLRLHPDTRAAVGPDA